jgi:hypothetical protein
MSADVLRAKLIRNFNHASFETSDRAPQNDGSQSARLARGTAAQRLGNRSTSCRRERACPYHFHYVEEVHRPEGEGCRWQARCCRSAPVTIFHSAGAQIPADPQHLGPAAALLVAQHQCQANLQYPDSNKYGVSARGRCWTAGAAPREG